MSLSRELGNILIKHNDSWRGDYYLKDDLTFTLDKTSAARFYLLRFGDSTILNGDRITINTGNKTLSIIDKNIIKLIDRDNDISLNSLNTFLISNGSDTTDPIIFNTLIYFISSIDHTTSLKYDWGLELISTPGPPNYRPRSMPILINENYNSSGVITPFQFILESADFPISPSLSPTVTHVKEIDSYKGTFMLLLLLVLLVLCIIISK